MFDSKRRLLSRVLSAILLLVILPSCQWLSAESKVERRGSTVPRNSREQLIFDHFQALTDGQYDEAYQQIAWHVFIPSGEKPSMESFIADREARRSQLPTKISIAEENERDAAEDEPCNYGYVVYVAVPGNSTLLSGEVGLHLDPDRPDTCVIGYNSAFGM